jgi:single-strand DNA-binding protein
MYNHVTLIGRLTKDPELKYTPSGVAVSTLRIAVDRQFKGASGERETDFVDVVAWRQSAEFAASYLAKGRLILVDGRLQIRNWTAQDGTTRRTAEVVANRLQALDRPREGAAPAPQGGEEGGEPAPQGGEDLSADLDDPFSDE